MPKFRFAIIGAGGIANKFADAVNLIEEAEVVAVAARDLERAKDFAARHKIAEAYGAYDTMLDTVKPDCVYIATVHSAHAEQIKMCINRNIPVICEKSMFLDAKEADEVIALAREKKVFLMEAMWSRFLPAVLKMQNWLKEGKIGKITYSDATVGWTCPKGDDNRFYSRALGGGAARDLLVYCYEMTLFFLGEDYRQRKVSSLIGPTGVDLTESVTLEYDNKLAHMSSSIVGTLDERLIICGDNGYAVLYCPHFATKCELYDNGRKLLETFEDTETVNGFVYEAKEVMNCVKAGLTESPVVPLELTRSCASLFDEIDRKA